MDTTSARMIQNFIESRPLFTGAKAGQKGEDVMVGNLRMASLFMIPPMTTLSPIYPGPAAAATAAEINRTSIPLSEIHV
jgi:hypothetical protein